MSTQTLEDWEAMLREGPKWRWLPRFGRSRTHSPYSHWVRLGRVMISVDGRRTVTGLGGQPVRTHGAVGIMFASVAAGLTVHAWLGFRYYHHPLLRHASVCVGYLTLQWGMLLCSSYVCGVRVLI